MRRRCRSPAPPKAAASRRRSKSPAPAARGPPSPPPLVPPPLVRTITQDGLKCAVCIDVLLDPVTLGCGHSVCLSCCVDYMETACTTPVPPRTVKCPFANCEVALAVPGVNIALRDTIIRDHADRVRKRRVEGVPAVEDLQPRIDRIRANVALGDRHRQMTASLAEVTRGRVGFLALLVVILISAAFLSGFGAARATTPQIVTGSHHESRTGDLAGFLRAASLDKPALDLPKLRSLPAYAAVLRVTDKGQLELLYRALATRGIHPLVKWDEADVTAWLKAMLPAQVPPEEVDGFLNATAAEELDGHALTMIGSNGTRFEELGLTSIYAQRLRAELAKLYDGSPSVYEWALANLNLANWLMLSLDGAPTLTAMRLRYGGYLHPPALLQTVTPYAACVRNQSERTFWVGALLFPYTCTIRALEASKGHELGPEWASRWTLRHLRFRHIGLIASALHTASSEATTVQAVISSFTRGYLVHELTNVVTYAMFYYVKSYILDPTIGHFVPISFGHAAFRWISLYLAPMGATLIDVMGCSALWTLLGSWAYRIFFAALLKLMFLKYSRIDVIYGDDDDEIYTVTGLVMGWVLTTQLIKRGRQRRAAR